MFEGLQIISHMPLVSILMPANTLSFFGFINNIASLNLIPVDFASKSLLDFNDFADRPYNDYFEFMNYSSLNNVLNLGLLYYLLMLNLFLIMFALFL